MEHFYLICGFLLYLKFHIVQEVIPGRLTKSIQYKYVIRDLGLFSAKVSEVLNHLIAARTTKSGSTWKITQILSYVSFFISILFKALAILWQTIIGMAHLTLMWTKSNS